MRISSRRRIAMAAAAIAALPLLAGCGATLSQYVDVRPGGGGALTLELRLDQRAQQDIDLERQTREGTFERFLDAGKERWRAPDEGNARVRAFVAASGVGLDCGLQGPIRRCSRPDGSVVMWSTRPLDARAAGLGDLRTALDVQRPVEPILSATGRYWAAPVPGGTDATTSTRPSSTAAPAGGDPQWGITGLPKSVPLQSLLSLEFTPAKENPKGPLAATFALASRGGIGDVLGPICDTRKGRYEKTRADRDLIRGLDFRYVWGMPSAIARNSAGATLSADRRDATWTVPYGQCPLVEISSAGAEDGRFVNGLILGGALVFLLIVFGWRAISRRAMKRREGS